MLDLYEMNCTDMLDLWLPDQSVQTCITSPPYFGLRDYGHPDQIGLEKTPEEFIAKLVAVFRGVHRVLRDDGTLWLNLGDSYARTGGTDKSISSTGKAGNTLKTLDLLPDRKQRAPIGLKDKDLIGIPWRVAFALQADGWYLRQDIIWQKPNPMPESVTDRCTKSHEYIFMLTKSPRYYFDHEAIKEPAVGKTLHDLTGQGYKAPGQVAHTGSRGKAVDGPKKQDGHGRRHSVFNDRYDFDNPEPTRNRRSVWNVSTKPFKGAHFATFPPDLIEPCVLAGSKPGDLVLDPFGGSGTTAGVALHHGRRAVLCELNAEYAEMVPSRVEAVCASLSRGAATRAVATSAA